MTCDLDLYTYGEITKIEKIGEYFKYHITSKETKKEIKMVLEWNVQIGDEVEILGKRIILTPEDETTLQKDLQLADDEYYLIVARHNITKNNIEKADSDVQFPTEVIYNKTEKEWNEIQLQKMHTLWGNANWVKSIYEKYTYLIDSGSSTRGARDPYTIKSFNDSVMYMTNARNILFYYCVERAKEKILEVHSEGYLTESEFKILIKGFYHKFVSLVKKIPVSYQLVTEFEDRFADIRYQVGL